VTYQKRSKTKGSKKKRGGGRGGQCNYSYQSNQPPQPTSSAALSKNLLMERTEKLIKSTLASFTFKEPISFTRLESEYQKYYQEEIPWRRLGFQSLERYLRSLPAVCKVSGSSISKVSPASSRPVGAAGRKEEKEKEVEVKRRLPETSMVSVWQGRVRTFLGTRKFGMLLSQVEKSYEKEWGESLPQDWRAQVSDDDIKFEEDGVRPVLVKLAPSQEAAGGLSAKVESPKVESPKVESPKVESPKLESPKLESIKEESTKLESAKLEVERMGNIVKIRPRGLFISQAQKIYEKEWGQVFPKDLWEQMEEGKLVTVNKVMKIVVWVT